MCVSVSGYLDVCLSIYIYVRMSVCLVVCLCVYVDVYHTGLLYVWVFILMSV